MVWGLVWQGACVTGGLCGRGHVWQEACVAGGMCGRRHAGADPGFPVGGGADPPGGAPTYDFAKFREKLHEIEKILGCRRGACRACPPKSTTAMCGTGACVAGGHEWQEACVAGACVVGACVAGACVAGACVAGGMHGRGVHGRGACMAGGMCGRGLVWQGACMAGGVHGRGVMCGRGCAWQGGLCGRGACMAWHSIN